MVKTPVPNLLVSLALFAALAVGGGCQGIEPERPARLASNDAQSLERVRAAIGRILDRPQIRFGAGDLARDGRISVLPEPSGPHEMRNTAVPVTFKLVLKGRSCFVVREGEAKLHPLHGVGCLPLTPP